MRYLYLVILLVCMTSPLLSQTYTIQGDFMQWHKITLAFDGPASNELDALNPFADYKLEVEFTNGSTSYTVQGYFAADGNAAETSADSGNVWMVHFAPDQIGTWNFTTSFVTGTDVAIGGSPDGTGILDNLSGSFNIIASDKTGRDHRGRGRLAYVGEKYLRFLGDSSWFYKAGADAPENTLAYEDFDAITNRGNRQKDWQAHQQDYVASDASDYTWQNGKGTELLGVVNYLSTTGVNAFSFLTFSLSGDDENVFPHLLKVDIPTYNTYGDAQQWNDGVYHDRFDVSKMAQWERIFEYADKKGMYLHFKTQETENDGKMDGGDVGRERKLYYRELVARFGHHLALNWNTGEENTQTAQQEIDMAAYLHSIDPYHHNIVIHTYPGQHNRYTPLLGNLSEYTGTSLQTSNNNFQDLNGLVATWNTNANNAGQKWIIAVDEPGNASIGTHVDPNDIKLVRHRIVWGILMGGGAGSEFYYGYQSGCGDLNCQDHRTRDQKYKEAAHAITFFEDYLQGYLPNVYPDNSITSETDDYAMSNGSNMVVVYRPDGGSTGITLDNSSSWFVNWFNPRTGEMDSTNTQITNTLTAPDGEDWVAILNTTCLAPGTLCDDGNANTQNDSIDVNCNCVGEPCLAIGTPCDDMDPTTYDDAEDGSCNCVGIAPIPIQGRVEAEAFFMESGTQVQNSSDVGGGQIVGYIQDGDFTKYKVEVGADGVYSITFRVSSNTLGGNLIYMLGTSTDTVSIPNTGGWDNWIDITIQDSLEAGIFDLMLNFEGGNDFLYNINYIDFNLINCVAGSDCDDGNPLTENDSYDNNCNCIGTLILFTSPLLEAEEATVGSMWTNTADSNACKCAYVDPPNSTAFQIAPANPEDHIRFNVQVDVAGAYKVFARVLTTNDGDDSFWVRANSGTWQKWNKINFPYTISGYQWSQVGNWTSGDNVDLVTFNLNAGTNTVDFAWREPGARLDKIYVTQGDLSTLNVVRKKEGNEEASFKYTLEEACPGDTITFEASLNGDTILVHQDSIPINKPLIILGSGNTNTILSGGNVNRIFTNHSELIVKNVKLIFSNPFIDGGAFLNYGTLILNNVLLEANKENGIPKSFTNKGVIYIEADSEVILKE